MSSGCDHPECNALSSWVKGGAPVRCSRIKVPKNNKCEIRDCLTQAVYNFDGKSKGRFCSEHKCAGMVNVISKRCNYEGCESLSPGFGHKDSKDRFCAQHKHDDMVNLKNKICEHVDCEETASYGFDDKSKYCSQHKLPNMVNLKHKSLSCEIEGCTIRKSFGLNGMAQRCSQHKTDEMVCVRTKKTCEQAGCTLGASFNFTGLVTGRFCSLHKLEGMEDVKSRRCETKGCDVTCPAFDLPGGKGRFCLTHKSALMINVRSKHCDFTDCKSINRQFDNKGGKGRFCAQHKQDGMVNVKSLMCVLCETSASYGKPGSKRTHCAKHRLQGMIKRPNALCIDCKSPAVWGLNWTPKHCETHRTIDEQNLTEKQCISCGLLYVLDDSGKCENCNPDAWSVQRLSKQNALMSYLDTRGLSGLSTDKIVDGGACGKERPDRIYDLGNKVVILECDEHQHRERACECEQTRMINIGQSFGGVPVYFIRWNPDDYSCADDKKEPELVSKRHKLVGDLISDFIKNRVKLPSGLVCVLYMYFDGWSSLADENWTVLTPFSC